MRPCHYCMHTSSNKMLQLPCAFTTITITIIMFSVQSSFNVPVKGINISHGGINANPASDVATSSRKAIAMNSNAAVRKINSMRTTSFVDAAKLPPIDKSASNTNYADSKVSTNSSTSAIINSAKYGNKASENTYDTNSISSANESNDSRNEVGDSNTNGYTNNNNNTVCRCMPDSACWPSLDVWDGLNNTLGGQLVRPNPPAAPCYDGPAQNITACQIAAANWMNPFWRADQVGAMQYSNKEAHGNQSCSLLSSPIISTYGTSFAFGMSNATMPPISSSSSSSQCQQGSVPSYAVEVLNSSHVQAAVSFASQHNLRLSIKSTGHDALGRSTAPGSLNLWMHRMRNITFQENFNPSGCDEDVMFPAVTVESGAQWGELYAAAEAKNLVVVGAMSASVSTGGGFLQGGGHSPLSPFLGLAADNVVEMKVVTADGRLQTANACQNRDLFWALRGGGGGTFGVVISSTHITYPPLLNVVNVHFIASSSNVTLFEELLVNFVYLQSSLSDDNFWAGYSYITSTPQPSLTINYLVPNCNTSIAQDSFQSLINFTSQYPNDIVVNMSINAFPSFGTWHNKVLCSANPGICSDPSGLNTVLASRLLPHRVLQGQPAQIGQAFMKILSSGVGQIVGHLVGGQAVAAGQNLAGQDRLNLLNKLGQSVDDMHGPDTLGQATSTIVAGQDGPHTHVLSGEQALLGDNVEGQDNKDVLPGHGNNVAGQEDVSSGQDGEKMTGQDMLRWFGRSPGFAKDVLRQYASLSGATDAQNGTNSVNPAFRAALWHVVLVNSWGEGESIVDSQTLTQMNGLLRDLSPGSGCYLNEADVNEPNWQDAFYGQHYNRLKAIKERLDPEGLFTCTNCVGSELWTIDAQVLCRRPTM
ncbi:hypothetical protein GOP47_0003435 [Adiantum capillus-veneris]|uniref:FAD-binding PCMH-type domain-containing protein n=1 Tax=Adiantum capillus-veneris TaxID=13818 RepID=A0A9D4ZSA1_ADICA|nr:hypothetical protein GOP47_0003435 [Adiantum capillus-veneris]